MKQTLIMLQTSLQKYILQQDDSIVSFIQKPLADSVKQRLDLYAEGYTLRLIEVLEIDYPKLKKWLGDTDFEALAKAYIAAYPSNRYSVNDYGRHLSDFLKKEHPQWSEMARFEWAISLALIAADSAIVNHQQIIAIPQEQWNNMLFTFHPSLQMVPLRWNTNTLWQALNQDQPLPEIQSYPQPEHWVVWRKQQEVHFVQLTQAEYQLLASLQQGHNLEEACEALALPADAMATLIVKFITQCLNAHWLIQVDLQKA